MHGMEDIHDNSNKDSSFLMWVPPRHSNLFRLEITYLLYDT